MIEDSILSKKLKKMNFNEMNKLEKEYYNLFLRPLNAPKDSMERLYKALLKD